jgi:hypothetical protein
MKISFLLFSLITAGSASAAIRGLNDVGESSKRELKGMGKGMGKKGSKSSKGKACFNTVYDAGAIANKVLADLWVDMYATGYEPAGIEKAFRAVLSDDVVVSLYGGVIFEGVDATLAALVGDATIPGSLTDLCAEHYGSWYAYSVLDMDPDDNKFVFCGNDNNSPYEGGSGLPIGMLKFEISESLT